MKKYLEFIGTFLLASFLVAIGFGWIGTTVSPTYGLLAPVDAISSIFASIFGWLF